jgi:RNA polymerase sigma-70 factor (ECF subfamily)
MAAVKGGDADAFNRLLRKYEGPLVNYLVHCTGRRTDAEDLAQETFLRVYRAAPGYEPRAKFFTWLYAIATNLCRDWRRKRKSDLLSRAAPTAGAAGDDRADQELPAPPERTAEDRQADAIVRTALDALPESQRLALTLKVYEGRSYEEIADILGTSIAAVESLIFRARQTLRRTLGPARGAS